MLNKIILQGRFTRDVELRRTQSGTSVCSFSLAVERDAKGQDGKRPVDFFDCHAWRGTAEMISKYFHKGSAAIVEGRLEIRDWTDRDGNKRRSAEVNVSNIYFAESKKSGDDSYSNGSAYSDYGSNSVDGGSGNNAFDGGTFDGGASDFSDIGEDDGELPF